MRTLDRDLGGGEEAEGGEGGEGGEREVPVGPGAWRPGAWRPGGVVL